MLLGLLLLPLLGLLLMGFQINNFNRILHLNNRLVTLVIDFKRH